MTYNFPLLGFFIEYLCYCCYNKSTLTYEVIFLDWRKSDIILGIPVEERNACISYLSPFVVRNHAAGGEMIHKSGNFPANLIIVEKGILQSVFYSTLGEEFSPFYYADGACIFHIALLTGNPVNSFCTALGSAEYASIPGKIFSEAIDRFPGFQKSLLMHICKTSEHLINHFVIVQMKRPRYKICKYLMSCCSTDGAVHELPFNMEKLAVYLNLARPTLSKELHTMEDDGLIRLSRGKIQILSIRMLCDELNEHLN